MIILSTPILYFLCFYKESDSSKFIVPLYQLHVFSLAAPWEAVVVVPEDNKFAFI